MYIYIYIYIYIVVFFTNSNKLFQQVIGIPAGLDPAQFFCKFVCFFIITGRGELKISKNFVLENLGALDIPLDSLMT